jgi:hypothetical protein
VEKTNLEGSHGTATAYVRSQSVHNNASLCHASVTPAHHLSHQRNVAIAECSALVQLSAAFSLEVTRKFSFFFHQDVDSRPSQTRLKQIELFLATTVSHFLVVGGFHVLFNLQQCIDSQRSEFSSI